MLGEGGRAAPAHPVGGQAGGPVAVRIDGAAHQDTLLPVGDGDVGRLGDGVAPRGGEGARGPQLGEVRHRGAPKTAARGRCVQWGVPAGERARGRLGAGAGPRRSSGVFLAPATSAAPAPGVSVGGGPGAPPARPCIRPRAPAPVPSSARVPPPACLPRLSPPPPMISSVPSLRARAAPGPTRQPRAVAARPGTPSLRTIPTRARVAPAARAVSQSAVRPGPLSSGPGGCDRARAGPGLGTPPRERSIGSHGSSGGRSPNFFTLGCRESGSGSCPADGPRMARASSRRIPTWRPSAATSSTRRV